VETPARNGQKARAEMANKKSEIFLALSKQAERLELEPKDFGYLVTMILTLEKRMK